LERDQAKSIPVFARISKNTVKICSVVPPVVTVIALDDMAVVAALVAAMLVWVMLTAAEAQPAKNRKTNGNSQIIFHTFFIMSPEFFDPSD